MFLRAKIRKKDGKRHRYFSVVENKRVAGGRVVQKHVLHLGEINDSQELAWRRSIEVLDEATDRPKTLSLFPEDRCEGMAADASIVRLKLSQLQLRRPRQWGACWLALMLWEELQLDRFWSERLPASRKGTRWDQELFVLVAYRLLAPAPGLRPGGSGGCIGSGLNGRRWPIFWAPISGSPRSTSFIVVMTGCWSTSKRCSII
jgi:hypothetical protein